MEEQKKSLFRAISVVLTVLLSALLGLAYVADLDKTGDYDIDAIKRLSAIVTLISLIFVLSIYVSYKQTE